MVVSTDDNTEEIAALLDLMLSTQFPHTYQPPSLLLSITGGAANFDLPLGLLQEVRKGIIQVAVSKNAWIITGGTNCGVMKLMGEIVRDSKGSHPLPLIGIRLCFYSCKHKDSTFFE